MTKKSEDPFFGLKLIAYCRSRALQGLEDQELTNEVLIDFAKWQICKERNVLFNDPIWDNYTQEEILIEYFAIKFDESEDLRTEFQNSIKSPTEEMYDWFDRMEKQAIEKAAKKVAEDTNQDEEFEDTYE